MQLEFYKYNNTNYFQGAAVYSDYLSVDKVYYKVIPEIYEKCAKEDDINAYHSGEFSFGFFLKMSELSRGGATIEEFFYPVVNAPFIIIAKFTLGGKIRCGVIDLPSLEFKKNPYKKEYELNVKSIGMLKHAIDYLKTVNLGDEGMGHAPEPRPAIAWGNYLSWHFQDVSSRLLVVDSLDLTAKVGVAVYINGNKLYGLFAGGLNLGHSVWQGLKSFMQVMGFAIKVDYKDEYTEDGATFLRFDLTLFWLSSGGNEKTIKPRENNTSFSWDYSNKYVLVKLAGGTGAYVMGLIMQNNSSWGTADDRMYYGTGTNSKVFDIYKNRLNWFEFIPLPLPGTPNFDPPEGWDSVINLDDIVIIEPEFHAWYYGNTLIAYASILTTATLPYDIDFTGLGWIILRTANEEYKYLIEGIKEVKEIPVEFLPTDQLALYDWFTTGGKNYRIDKLSTDIVSRTADIRAIEI